MYVVHTLDNNPNNNRHSISTLGKLWSTYSSQSNLVKDATFLTIYFAYGASTFITIADSFFIKEKLGFSASTIMSIGVWLSLPWTIKMVFGQLVDSIRIFKSNRLSYILFAAILMTLSSIMLAGLAGRWSWIIQLGTAHQLYLTAMLINVIGVVL